MKYVVYDFDGTITTRDTTRFLVKELLRLRPYKLPIVVFVLSKLFLKRSPEVIQECKNRCIGILVKGLSYKTIEPSLAKFSHRIGKLFRPDLIKSICENIGLGNKVIIASASPEFALKYIFSNYNVTVIATKFRYTGGSFTGSMSDVSCFGESKAKTVQEFLKDDGKSGIIECAWSDSISDLPVMMLAKKRVWFCSSDAEPMIKEVDPKGYRVITT